MHHDGAARKCRRAEQTPRVAQVGEDDQRRIGDLLEGFCVDAFGGDAFHRHPCERAIIGIVRDAGVAARCTTIALPIKRSDAFRVTGKPGRVTETCPRAMPAATSNRRCVATAPSSVCIAGAQGNRFGGRFGRAPHDVANGSRAAIFDR